MASFAPIISSSPNPRILILGSMPSQKSLQKQQYYANPRNAFWWLMAKLLEASMHTEYVNRVQQVTASGIGVWDVLHDCDRPGSLDRNIVRSSEAPNDVIGLLTRYPSIRIVGFNGAAANTIFKRHWSAEVALLSDVEFVQLPSTSPAHARLSRDEKLTIWRAALSDFLPKR